MKWTAIAAALAASVGAAGCADIDFTDPVEGAAVVFVLVWCVILLALVLVVRRRHRRATSSAAIS